MPDEIYKDGLLEGMWSGTVLLTKQTTEWLQHASKETGYSIDRLVEIAADEAALGHAKANGLLK
jgi:hypothetical protein